MNDPTSMIILNAIFLLWFYFFEIGGGHPGGMAMLQNPQPGVSSGGDALTTKNAPPEQIREWVHIALKREDCRLLGHAMGLYVISPSCWRACTHLKQQGRIFFSHVRSNNTDSFPFKSFLFP